MKRKIAIHTHTHIRIHIECENMKYRNCKTRNRSSELTRRFHYRNEYFFVQGTCSLVHTEPHTARAQPANERTTHTHGRIRPRTILLTIPEMDDGKKLKYLRFIWNI